RYLRYPANARENNIQGRTLIKFIVNTLGEIEDIEVLRRLGGGCSEETIRVIKLMPNWMPSFQDGLPVKVYFNLPVSFKLFQLILYKNSDKHLLITSFLLL